MTTNDMDAEALVLDQIYGSYALCVTTEPSIWMQDASAQQVELRSAIHLPL